MRGTLLRVLCKDWNVPNDWSEWEPSRNEAGAHMWRQTIGPSGSQVAIRLARIGGTKRLVRVGGSQGAKRLVRVGAKSQPGRRAFVARVCEGLLLAYSVSLNALYRAVRGVYV